MAEAAVKSSMFTWEGVDRHGKRVKGEMSGQNDALIKAQLRRQGVNPLKVKKKSKPCSANRAARSRPRTSPFSVARWRP